jgi:hypothetical protein
LKFRNLVRDRCWGVISDQFRWKLQSVVPFLTGAAGLEAGVALFSRSGQGAVAHFVAGPRLSACVSRIRWQVLVFALELGPKGLLLGIPPME